MTTVVVSPVSVAAFPEGGGHFWVFLQWIRGLERCGCDVWWLECLEPKYGRPVEPRMVDRFLANLEAVGLGERALLYCERDDGGLDFDEKVSLPRGNSSSRRNYECKLRTPGSAAAPTHELTICGTEQAARRLAVTNRVPPNRGSSLSAATPTTNSRP